ncbi:hypothetical protein Mpsy_0696 [Methanolobus psychrophilus R15]|nr:hypothetical protein Mpsy_0696 [Methanolobus psychrophilus R15]
MKGCTLQTTVTSKSYSLNGKRLFSKERIYSTNALLPSSLT